MDGRGLLLNCGPTQMVVGKFIVLIYKWRGQLEVFVGISPSISVKMSVESYRQVEEIILQVVKILRDL